MSDKVMSRKEFLQKLGLGALSVAVAGHFFNKPIIAQAGVTDNLPSGSGGVSVDTAQPANPNMVWINPEENECGKYFNGTKWVPFTSRSYIKSDVPPVNSATLWLNKADKALYYNNGEGWVPVNALWG